jgi:hypothetical protein
MSQPINYVAPVFPTPAGTQHNDGMTLRDYFAAAALPVAWKAYESFAVIGDNANQELAKAAYQIADAMIRARECK